MDGQVSFELEARKIERNEYFIINLVVYQD
jgi:hypothetical protein